MPTLGSQGCVCVHAGSERCVYLSEGCAPVLGLRDECACYLYLGHVCTWRVLCTCVFMLSSALCAQTLGLGVCVGHAYRLLVCVSELGSWVCLCRVGFRAT